MTVEEVSSLGGSEMTGERGWSTASVEESPAIRHRHRIGMAPTDVVIGGVSFVGKDVKNHDLVAVVVLKRGGGRRAASRSCTRTFHVLTLSLGTV